MNLDLSGPTAARVYDCLLGGKDNFMPDRDLAERMLAVAPRLADAAGHNRAFVARAVRAVAELGIGQFLDIGAGLPTLDNLHEIAARHTHGPRVVYLDHDPVAVVHARALLLDSGRIAAARADLREPDALLKLPEVRRLSFDRPIAVFLTAVLHHLTDADDPAATVQTITAALPPGSAVVISHGTADADRARARAAAARYNAVSPFPVTLRGKAEVEALFAGTRLLAPGLAFTTEWRPEGPARPPEHALAYAGVGILPT